VKNARSARFLKKREPQVIENVKTAMFIKGPKTSEVVTAVMDDLYALKKPAALKYNKKESNSMKPFEGTTSVEFFSTKSDASLFVYGTHSKKRPHNITIGRLFNYHILDLLELGIIDYKPMQEFNAKSLPMLGSKPCFTVIGAQFQSEEKYTLAANLIVDFFRGEIVSNINLKGLDHVISLSVGNNGVIQFRHYAIIMKKSGTRVPLVELEEIGPSIDFVYRRSQFGAEALRKESLAKPRVLNPRKQKNISTNTFRDKIGTVHVSTQDISHVHDKVKKPKALRKRKTLTQSEGGDTDLSESGSSLPATKRRRKTKSE
jgi:ribosome production factor 2